MLYDNTYMELPSKIYTYYLENNTLLGQDKLFHFGSRMAAWKGDPAAYKILAESRDFIVQPEEQLDTVIKNVINKPQTGRRNAHELRKPFFQKYPQLYGAHMALFRVRHLEAVYGIDARSALFATIPEDDLVHLEHMLLQDDEAIRALSTFAVNYCYLLERVVRKNEESLPLQHFYDIGTSYDTDDSQHIQLLIYLYTHCIIGESNFYTRRIPQSSIPLYHKMLQSLETVIEKHFDKINLDNKLEFLVCARICSFATNLTKRIYDECEHSVSPHGTFVIDVHNSNVQDDRNDFAKSEHRNVLYIMSSTEYTPHSTLLR